MICDSHIHVGQFRDVYTSPEELVAFLDDVGVDKFAVSSTSIWEEDYDKVLHEITGIQSDDKFRQEPRQLRNRDIGTDLVFGRNFGNVLQKARLPHRFAYRHDQYKRQECKRRLTKDE